MAVQSIPRFDAARGGAGRKTDLPSTPAGKAVKAVAANAVLRDVHDSGVELESPAPPYTEARARSHFWRKIIRYLNELHFDGQRRMSFLQALPGDWQWRDQRGGCFRPERRVCPLSGSDLGGASPRGDQHVGQQGD